MRWLLTPRWLLGHVVVAALAAGMLKLGWWQLERARSGHALSIGYSLEWPIFAGFVVFFWVRVLRRAHAERAPSAPAATAPLPPPQTPSPAAPQAVETVRRLAEQRAAAQAAARTAAADPHTAEYNHYLAWLNANPHRRPADYPGPPGS